MGGNPLQEELNRIFWDEQIEKSDYSVVYSDMLETGGKKEIKFTHIEKIDSFGINVLGSDHIPMHKIIAIKLGDLVIWDRIKT